MLLGRCCIRVALVATVVCMCASSSVAAGDQPNRSSQTDVAAGRIVDSIFEHDAPATLIPKRKLRRRSIRPAPAHGKLVHNPETTDGSPTFALVDRYGGIRRYVEPVDGVDLESYLGKQIAVRRDTGDTLLASQLVLPPLDGEQSFTGLRLVDYEEEVALGEIVGESILVPEAKEPYYLEEGPLEEGPLEESPLEEGLYFEGGAQCGTEVGRYGRRGGCGPGSRGVVYARAEYLLMWMEGMNTPPLVIQDDNANFTSPDIIFGGSPVLDGTRNGGRITVGLWLDECGKWGIEGDYLFTDTVSTRFSAGTKDGLAPTSVFIGRPFFNTLAITGVPRGRSREDVDTTDLDGTVTVDVRSEFRTGGIRLRHNLCCSKTCPTECGDGVACGSGVVGCGSGCGAGVGCPLWPRGRLCRLLGKGTRRTDITWGVRWASLDDSLDPFEDLQELTTPNAAFLVNDMFSTSNDFFGGELGFIWEWEYRRWSLELLSKMAIGNTRQRVRIDGSTQIDGVLTENISGNDRRGGLLAQSGSGAYAGNIGTYERDEFSVLPELGLTFGFNVTERFRLTAGYSLFYWSNIVRPGDQIDLDVNASLIPSDTVAPDAVSGDHPRFVFTQTDAWIQGLRFGGEMRW